MTLNEIKAQLGTLEKIGFQLPDGSMVPSHFHVTEVGKVTKDFIDCGGKRRSETVVNFQLWDSDDYDHRLHPEKLVHIINLSEKTLGLEDWPIEVEYQGSTINKYNLEFNGEDFVLVSKATDCLASDKCGIPQEKKMVDLGSLTANSCAPGGGCC